MLKIETKESPITMEITNIGPYPKNNDKWS